MTEPIPFGKYLLLDRINVGGMAEVYKAKAFGVEGFERTLAIKRILPTMAEDEEFINMFIDEARIAVQLSHANIVPVFELGRLDNQYYIAMEYVAGRDLRQLLDRFRKKDQMLPLAASAYITAKICEGLDYAHRKTDASGKPLHLIHRDVSPQNILISFEGAVKITDFGIVKAEDRTSKTQAGVLKGKFAYMSPEQVRGLEIDHRSDIFAVGILLYEMVTGKRLFVGESDFQTLERVRAAVVQPPRELNADISEDFERVVLKALARERDDRYANAAELAEDLQPFLIADGTVFTGKRLSQLLHDEFAHEIENERRRMEEFANLPPRSDYEQRLAQQHLAAPTGDWDGARAEKTVIFESDFHDVVADTPPSGTPLPNMLPVSERPTLGMDGQGAQGQGAPYVPPRTAYVPRTPRLFRSAAVLVGLLVLAGAASYAWLRRGAGESGTLIVTSVPVQQVSIYLDGVLLAQQTPHTQRNVGLGPHRLVARAPGFRDKAYKFELEAGDPATIPVELERDASLALPGESSLEVTSDPPMASVRIGGLPQGTTPMTLQHPDTAHPIVLEISKPGYAPQSLSVSFAPGERQKHVNVKLQPPGGATVSGSDAPRLGGAPANADAATLTVRSRPPGAAVFVGGVQKGVTPLTMTELNAQASYAIDVVHDGFRPSENVVHMNGRTAVELDAALVPLRAAGGVPRAHPIGCGGTGAKLSIMALDVGDCKVTVGKVALGVAPMFKKDCPVGRCPIEVRCPGNKLYRATRILRAGQEEKIIIKPTDWQ